MKTSFLNLLALFAVSTILFSCSPADDGIYFENSEVVNTTNVTYTTMENDILALVNAHRTSLGLTSLAPLDIISGVADGHTEYMIEVGSVNHDNFSQRAQNLMDNAGAKTVGENVAYGFSTAEGVVNGWLNSPEHKSIIENPNYTHFGISTETNKENRNYFTQIFIKK
ncbi:CAP domain-containing protein [Lutibacter sp.]|uniref:CAP domain-containing protein n=1 Tax=Lutibacter sp. TaxID=1925666 RepID=UPI001A2B7BC8|nr:CAP domain-containing protein [Lutibacter sp.]MBI9041254.1 CAP domain-containing protein [Lutibacter sp.]MBI9041258.1 CAP domain-containing protein [Lutibacter sp.]